MNGFGLTVVNVSSDHLPNTIARFKSFTARKIIDLFTGRGEKGILRQLGCAKPPHKTDREYQFRQEGSHPVLIQSREIKIIGDLRILLRSLALIELAAPQFKEALLRSAKEMGLGPVGNAAGLGERAMGKILTAIPILQNLFSMDLDKRHIH